MLALKKPVSFSLVTALCLFVFMIVLVSSFFGSTHAMENEPNAKTELDELFEIEKLPEHALRNIAGYSSSRNDLESLASTSKVLHEVVEKARILYLKRQLQQLPSSTIKLLTTKKQPPTEPGDILFLNLLQCQKKQLRKELRKLTGPEIKMLCQRLPFIQNYERILDAAPGDEELRSLLQGAGTNINTQNENGWTALMHTSRKIQVEATRLLLESGAKADLKDNRGRTALMEASRAGCIEMVQLLLDVSANVDAKDEDGRTALMMASANGHAEVVRLLLNAGANVDATDEDGRTALMIASAYGHTKVVELLMGFGADFDTKDKDDWTALMMASANGHVEVVGLLLNADANVNAIYKYNWTALMIASANGHVEVVGLLLNAGANVDATDGDGQTALMMASAYGRTKVVELLQGVGGSDASSNTLPTSGTTPLTNPR